MTSRRIESNQTGIHPRLESLMRKHLSHEFRRPVPDYSQRSFAWVFDRISDFRGPLVFDPFCGVGGSTVKLAKAMPDALVVGIDKSHTDSTNTTDTTD